MSTFFDLYAVGLFVACASIFFLRYRHENPPMFPYLVICLACAIGNWLGNLNISLAAVVILGAASFLLLQITSTPYREDDVGNDLL